MTQNSEIQMIWGPGPLPTAAVATGFVRHPIDGMTGLAIFMPTGITVHGAAGVIRNMEPRVKQYATLRSLFAASLGRKGGRARKEANE